MATTDQTINFPQLILIIVVSGLAIRYFFFSSPNTSATSSQSRHAAANSATNIRAREADVERIQQMFPQVSRRSIMWDLQRNGGNVVATTERVLSGRGLEVPPQSFQPPQPVPASSTPSGSSSTNTQSQPKASQPDLITRYNLKSKILEEESLRFEAEVAESPSGAVATAAGKQKQKQAWSANKGERQALLQKRREEMILAARRKMEEKVRKEGNMG